MTKKEEKQQDIKAHKAESQKQSSLDFSNTEIAFKGMSDKELYQSWLIFSSFRFPLFVSQGPRLAPSLMKLPWIGKSVVKPIIASTVFRQFCGGDSLENSMGRVKELALRQVGSILDYSVEGLGQEADFQQAYSQILATIRFAKEFQPKLPFAVFKATGMVRADLLEKQSRGLTLTEEESRDFSLGYERMQSLFKEAHRLKVRLMVDAEETWVQPAIDKIVYDGMRVYNKTECVIYNTLQMYRVDRLKHMQELLVSAQKEKFKVGLKLVRGAYMEKERLWAKSQGIPSPILASKDLVDDTFDEAVKLGLEQPNTVELLIGTHNENSSYKAVALMGKNQELKSTGQVVFSQLLGMSDHISFNLAHHGFQVAKYVPYGPLTAVMPYLGRRAEENSSIHGQIGRELSLIQQEIRRRRENKR